ncbi:MAG: CHAT domain-containing protein [Spirosomaceae bacterium]|nr:CHAT domain-containing protein [Spirosomataceae bacterium]
MTRKLITVVSTFLLASFLFSSAQKAIPDFDKYFKVGNSFYDTPNPTEKTDNEAIYYFQKAVNTTKIDKFNATKAVDAATKVGILHQTYLRYTDAIKWYIKAIELHRQFRTHDTTSFLAHMYLGMTHYHTNDYSNCYFYLNQAEKIYKKYNLTTSSESLFNTLGVLYFESGNYRQSINYFTKAQNIEFKLTGKSTNSALQSNIATALRHLNKNEEALQIYKEVLKENPDETRIRVNLASTFLALNQPENAFAELNNIKKENDPKTQISIQNLEGRAYVLLKKYDLAIAAFKKAISIFYQAENINLNGKNSEIGNTFKFMGDISSQNQSWGSALNYYQKALFHLDSDFKDESIFKNPVNFSANLNNVLLFETLKAKGRCFEQMYQLKPNSLNLYKSAVETYQVAFQLAKFLLSSYDNEEARLHLAADIYPFFSTYIDLLLRGYEKFNDPKYLEQAFVLSERSKSSVLAVNLNESFLKNNDAVPDSLILQEKLLNLTKSKLLLNNNFDQFKNIEQAQQVNDIEIKLSRLKAEARKITEKAEQKEQNLWDLKLLKSEFLANDEAVFSIYKINQEYVVFLLNQSNLRVYRIANAKRIDFMIDLLNSKITNTLYGKTYTGETQEKLLYELFFSAFEDDLKEIKKLIIIPHFETVRLPFETLKNAQNQYILSRFAVLYQYSIDVSLQAPKQKYDLDKTLVYAPFTEASSGNTLPASLKEIETIGGNQKISKLATKQSFLSDYKNSSVIHLATHATADNTIPQKSFISFYPASQDTLLNRIYVDEIKLLELQNTDLVFLSACETSSGKQIQNEGIMSLSRAFSLAGCSNIITSLWKAEDEATAYISKHFYEYLEQGKSIEYALQLAKLDLLEDPKMVQYHSPAYWGHLIMIGVPEQKSYVTVFIIVGIILTATSAFLLYRRLNPRQKSVIS